MVKDKRSKRSLLSHPRKNIYENVWIVEYTNTSLELLEEFNTDLKKAFNRKGQWRLKHHKIRIASVKWILDLLELRCKGSYTWFVPTFIVNSNKRIIAAWLRAFFDDEGTVSKQETIRIKSMNRNGLSQVRNLLLKFNIKTSLTGPNCDNSYYLHVYKRFNHMYHRHIGFNHLEKQRKLNRIINGPGEKFRKTP